MSLATTIAPAASARRPRTTSATRRPVVSAALRDAAYALADAHDLHELARGDYECLRAPGHRTQLDLIRRRRMRRAAAALAAAEAVLYAELGHYRRLGIYVNDVTYFSPDLLTEADEPDVTLTPDYTGRLIPVPPGGLDLFSIIGGSAHV